MHHTILHWQNNSKNILEKAFFCFKWFLPQISRFVKKSVKVVVFY
jgi:hypothetical protein